MTAKSRVEEKRKGWLEGKKCGGGKRCAGAKEGVRKER